MGFGFFCYKGEAKQTSPVTREKVTHKPCHINILSPLDGRRAKKTRHGLFGNTFLVTFALRYGTKAI